MRIRFLHQALIGSRVHGVGEVFSFPAREAERLIADGVAEALPEPAPVREATDPTAARALRAVNRGETAPEPTPVESLSVRRRKAIQREGRGDAS